MSLSFRRLIAAPRAFCQTRQEFDPSPVRAFLAAAPSAFRLFWGENADTAHARSNRPIYGRWLVHIIRGDAVCKCNRSCTFGSTLALGQLLCTFRVYRCALCITHLRITAVLCPRDGSAYLDSPSWIYVITCAFFWRICIGGCFFEGVLFGKFFEVLEAKNLHSFAVFFKF